MEGGISSQCPYANSLTHPWGTPSRGASGKHTVNNGGLEARAEGPSQPLTRLLTTAASHPLASPAQPVGGPHMPLQLTTTRGRSHTPFLHPLDVEAGVARRRLSPGRRCLCPGNAGPPNLSPPLHTHREKRESPRKLRGVCRPRSWLSNKSISGEERGTLPQTLPGSTQSPWPPPKCRPHGKGAQRLRARAGPCSWAPGARLAEGPASGWSGVPGSSMARGHRLGLARAEKEARPTGGSGFQGATARAW